MTRLGCMVRAGPKKVDVKEAVGVLNAPNLDNFNTPPFHSQHELAPPSSTHTRSSQSYKSAIMVELVEVEDESFETKQNGPSDEEDYYTDTGMPSSTINAHRI